MPLLPLPSVGSRLAGMIAKRGHPREIATYVFAVLKHVEVRQCGETLALDPTVVVVNDFEAYICPSLGTFTIVEPELTPLDRATGIQFSDRNATESYRTRNSLETVALAIAALAQQQQRQRSRLHVRTEGTVRRKERNVPINPS